MRINNENFEHVIGMMFYGCRISAHNPDCFSSADLRDENWAEECCQDVINKIRDQGYDPALIVPIINRPEINMEYYPEPNPALKQERDEGFGGFEVNTDLYMRGLSAWQVANEDKHSPFECQ